MGVQIGPRYYPQDRRSKMSTTTDTGLRALQDGLQIWTSVERHTGTDEVREHDEGSVHVTEVYAYPEQPEGATRADVHFVVVAPTEGFPTKEALIDVVRGALGEGEFGTMTDEDLAEGPSYIALGGWLGSQELALRLIGAVELAGIARAITPKLLGIEGPGADQMAGIGYVMLGPSTVWEE
jgi:hypothetical protein